MHSIYHILITLWHEKVVLFWPIWTTLTVVAVLLTGWFVGRAKAVPVPGDGTAWKNPAMLPQSVWSKKHWLAIAMFVLIVAGYIALIFVWENFSFYDNSQLTLFSLKGHAFPPPIWVESGRFFPLGFQEFNLISHVSRNVFAYHALPVLELLIVCLILLNLDEDLRMNGRVFLAICILLTLGMVISFGGLIYPERNLVFWLLCLLLFVKRFDRTQSTAAAMAAIVSAQFLLYYKETAFLLLWGFAVGRLWLRCRNADRRGWNLGRLREKASRLDFCLIVLGFLFLGYYGAVMFRHSNLQYEQQTRLPESIVLFDYFKMDLLAFLFLAVVLGRIYLIWRRRIVPSMFWEGLGLGGLAYFVGFLYLRMVSAYYLTPVDVIAVLYLGRCAILSWNRLHWNGKTAVAVALCCVLVQNISLSAVREYFRKNLIHANAEIADVIQARCQHDRGASQRLFFPFASRYVTMEFGAYLSYRGLPVEGGAGSSGGTNGVFLVSRAMTKDGPVVAYRDIMGYAGRAPAPGDLVVVLPEDEASLAEIESFMHGGDTIFSYSPFPRLPGWMSVLVRRLHFATPRFVNKALPENWLHASVTVWDGSKPHEL